jgi:hypothetical protein
MAGMSSESSFPDSSGGQWRPAGMDEISARRRADPRAYVCEFLRFVYEENDPDDARALLKHEAQSSPWNADDGLYCLDRVISDPPDDLIEFIEGCADIALARRDDRGNVHPFSYNEALDWLRNVRSELAALREASQPS